MPTQQAEWTTWLLQAINRVQTAYIRHQDSYLTLNLLLDSLLKLTGSDYGFVGEHVTRDEGDAQICFYHKGDLPWRPEKLTRYSAPVSVRRLIERDAVIGLSLDNWMIHPGWKKGESSKEMVSLNHAADHIDHICGLAGNTRHSAIGSDLDGGFGAEQTPRELDTIADIQRLADILAARGYTDADIDAIFHGNWLRFFSQVLPG